MGKTQTHNTKYKRKSILTVTATYNVNSRAYITAQSWNNYEIGS